MLSHNSLKQRSGFRYTLWFIGGLLLLPLTGRAVDPHDALPLRAVIIGGGPNLENNQCAIESNVRYVNRLLPIMIPRTTLFADGNAENPTVLYDIDARNKPVGERLMKLIFKERDSSEINATQYKKPNLGGRLDGATRTVDVRRTFSRLVEDSRTTSLSHLFFYFTGHGSSDRQSNENNVFDMWGNEVLTVRDLAKQIARLPINVPITLVMVQCHSGSFANLIFEAGDPHNDAVDRDIVGYFATIKERVAAGCTSEVNEAEYRDFTSYFFAALTGRDRVGRKVLGADYNRDGRVGMDEAYCYTLANDRSVDVPVCTSDIFLRHFMPTPDAEVFKTPFSKVVEWATPAQRYALIALSRILKREKSEDRLQKAYGDMVQHNYGDIEAYRDTEGAWKSLTRLRESAKRKLQTRYPGLSSEANSRAYERDYQRAASAIAEEAKQGDWQELIQADDKFTASESNQERQQSLESHIIRFVRLGKSVILAHQLRESENQPLISRFERLVKAEGASLLAPVAELPQEQIQN